MMSVMPTDLRRRTVSRGGVDLAVFEGGNPEGPTIVMVHGWPDTHTLWTGVAERLAPDFHVVAYDLRGMGESSDPGPVAAFAMAEQADDLLAVVDAVSPDRPVHLLAHDWGSVAAWEAVCRPGAEARILSYTSISGPSLDHVGSWVRRSLRRPTPASVGGVVAQLASSWYMALFVTPLARSFFGRFGTQRRWSRFLQRVEGLEPQPWHHAPTLQRDMVSGLRIYRANVLPGLMRSRGPQVTTVPVQQVAPLRDVAIRGASLRESELWTERLERVEIPYGHWVALGHPDVVAGLVSRFVSAEESRRAA
jgi:pimeloyl-ACP methyl ester carboxylesterase